MCMIQQKSVQIESFDAYKIFTHNNNKELQSAFSSSFKDGLIYPKNTKITTDNPDSLFFAFKNFKDAMYIVSEQRNWNFVNRDLIVLPVTMYNVVIQGKFHSPSNDPQCLDGYYDAFQSKEIVVHYNKEYQEKFDHKVLFDFFKYQRLTQIQKQVFSKFLPLLVK